MDKKTVSIVIPTFNRSDFLKKAIEASLGQTYGCEVIVCDHGSTDDTPKVVKSYGEKVRYVRREEDFGPHFCWLDGILHTKGEYVHIQYDDDWILPNFVEKCLHLMSKEVGFVFCEADIFEEKTQQIKERKQHRRFKPDIVNVSKAEDFVVNNLISPGAVFLRKKDAIDALYQGSLPFQKDTYHGVGPDHMITLLPLLRYKKIGYIPEGLAVFRSHDGSITIDAAKDKKKKAQIAKAYAEAKRYYKDLKFCKCLKPHQIVDLFSWKELRRKLKFARRRIKKLFKR